MDPLSALGAAGAVEGLIDVAGRCVSSLHAMQQRWKDADLTVALLASQTSTLKAALGQISDWINTTVDIQTDHQLVMDLELALRSCRLLLTFIDDHVTTLVTDDYNELIFESKARAMVQDRKVQEWVNHMNN